MGEEKPDEGDQASSFLRFESVQACSFRTSEDFTCCLLSLDPFKEAGGTRRLPIILASRCIFACICVKDSCQSLSLFHRSIAPNVLQNLWQRFSMFHFTPLVLCPMVSSWLCPASTLASMLPWWQVSGNFSIDGWCQRQAAPAAAMQHQPCFGFQHCTTVARARQHCVALSSKCKSQSNYL